MPPMLRCGLSISVPAAPEAVKKRAHYVTTRHGGSGAVREACELIMQAQGTFDALMEPFFK
jgi:3-deoxy-D-manno-octulosonate 8-phosphate phosphatase (KDO 8-P phosphatase)